MGCSTSPTKTEGEGTTLGALAGAVIGGIAGNQAGGSKGAVIGAIAGAVIGGFAGHSWAKRVEAVRGKYKTEDERVAAEIALAKDLQTELAKQNMKLAGTLRQETEEVKKLQAKFQNNEATRYDLFRKKQRIDTECAQAEKERGELEKAVAAEEQALAQARAARVADAEKLENEIVEHRNQLANLLQLEKELINVAASSSA